MQRYVLTPAETVRFWASVDIRGADECWPWRRGTRKGYGFFCFGGRTETAHRVAYALTHSGEFDPELLVCHSCDNRPCCNPGHHFQGTIQDNMRDRDTKGRQAKGHKGHPYKLTASHVAEIRALRGTVRQRELAARFGVSQAMIARIYAGRVWAQTSK